MGISSVEGFLGLVKLGGERVELLTEGLLLASFLFLGLTSALEVLHARQLLGRAPEHLVLLTLHLFLDGHVVSLQLVVLLLYGFLLLVLPLSLVLRLLDFQVFLLDLGPQERHGALFDVFLHGVEPGVGVLESVLVLLELGDQPLFVAFQKRLFLFEALFHVHDLLFLLDHLSAHLCDLRLQLLFVLHDLLFPSLQLRRLLPKPRLQSRDLSYLVQ